ncbi:hypothetical protein TNCV_4897221 [Trichonephila clavipes]|nr:hypothetical protein TNCV_4897221 [Trichonephila clavipes]
MANIRSFQIFLSNESSIKMQSGSVERRKTSHMFPESHPYSDTKGRTKLDAGCKGQSLQDVCRLFARKFFFQTQQQGLQQAVEPLSANVVVRLMPSSNPICLSGLNPIVLEKLKLNYILA